MFCLSFLTSVKAQKVDILWDYGLNANFNVSFIKPISSDSFSNKAGFGAGLMLEAGFGKYAFQVAPSFAQTSYINDNNLAITTMKALDASFDFVYQASEDGSGFLVAGLIPAINFSHIEKKIDGSKTSGLSNTPVSGARQFDLAAKVGAGLKLNDGIRFNFNFINFIKGSQKKGSITGRVDYLQFGIQLRFNELMNGDKVSNKNLKLQFDAQVADSHLQAINNGALMVFVLPELIAKGIYQNEQIQNNEKLAVHQSLLIAINDLYKVGTYVVIEQNEMQNLISGNILNILNPHGETQEIEIQKPFYVAKIGEFFIGNNTNLSWGVRVFDSQMEDLLSPFPYYIPYRNVDKRFKVEESLRIMIAELNSALLIQ